MASPPLSDDVLREAVKAKQQAGSELGAAKRIRSGESVRDVCGGLVDVVLALSGRI